MVQPKEVFVKYIETFWISGCFWTRYWLLPKESFATPGSRSPIIGKSWRHSQCKKKEKKERKSFVSIWTIDTLKKLDYWSLANFFISVTKHANLFVLDRNQTACARCQFRARIHDMDKSVVLLQCDEMARFCFQFWPFTTMKLCPKAYIILPN